jgi:hypothetical protein
MKTVLLDLWYDLREKRLWPLAVLLAVAVAAVPLVLRKDAEPAPAPVAGAAPQAQTADADAEALAIKALEEGSLPSSKLDKFSAKNPFRPLVKERSVEEVASQLGSTPSTPAGGDPSDAGGTGGGDAGGSTGGGGSPPSPSGDVGPVDTEDDTGEDTGDDTADDAPDKKTLTEYAYVVDLTFIANDRRRRIKGMEKLDILPSAANPLLLFLGVTDNAGNAVFLVDSTLKAAGEGRCKPNPEQCAFVYIGPGSEHQFANEEGDSYTLRVDEIRRVKLGDGKKAGASKKNKKKVAGAALEQPSPARRFSPPLLADMVSVSSGEAIHSNSDSDRR